MPPLGKAISFAYFPLLSSFRLLDSDTPSPLKRIDIDTGYRAIKSTK